MGEIDPSDIYHHFKPYREDMRAWIHDISEGESAFDNEDINKRPYKIVDGEIVVHNNKHGDKYTRQCWDKVGPCVHTYMANLKRVKIQSIQLMIEHFQYVNYY